MKNVIKNIMIISKNIINECIFEKFINPAPFSKKFKIGTTIFNHWVAIKFMEKSYFAPYLSLN